MDASLREYVTILALKGHTQLYHPICLKYEKKERSKHTAAAKQPKSDDDDEGASLLTDFFSQVTENKQPPENKLKT